MANFLTRFDPFTDLASYAPLRDMDGLWGEMRRQLRDDPGAAGMRLDVAESEKAYTVRIDVPGVKKEDIRVDVEGNRVAVSAEVHRENDTKDGKVVRTERYVGRQYRSFTLDHAIDDASAVARYENGVLQLTLPKKHSAASRKLQIA